MSSGQWMTDADGTRWFFEAGADCLDFAHTGAILSSGDRHEELLSPADLGDWLAARHPGLDADMADERDLRDALHLREAIANIALALVERERPRTDDIDTVNLFAATPDIPPILPGGGRQAGSGRIRIGQGLSALARDAVTVFLTDAGRLRRCDAADCRRLFRDESRAGTRRWCSMQRCGNRAKVRAHRMRAQRS